MTRLSPLTDETFSDEQRRAIELISASRSTGLGGPFSVLFRAPNLAIPANELHNEFRLRSAIGRRLLEFLILIVATKYQADYVKTFHVLQARKIGIAPETVEALCAGQRPDTLSEQESVLCKVVYAVLANGKLDDDLFKEASAAFGEAKLIEIVAGVGFYSMICFLVNAFQVPGVDTGGANNA